MIRLGVYTRYDMAGASSRMRYLRYAGMLGNHGFDVRLHPLFHDDYLRALYCGRSRVFAASRDMLSRLYRMPPPEENLWIEYELLPGLPFPAEKLFLGRRRYVLGFDDAVYLKYSRIPFLRGKYDRLAAAAAGVMAANEVLLEYFSALNPNTIKVPTVVDTDAFAVGAEKFKRFTVVWIGTPVTCAAYLLPFAPVLRRMREKMEFDLLVIGGTPDPRLDFAGVRLVPWSEQAETGLLPKCHVGIMPLPANNAFAAGKSAYKIIQYMAAGIPAVASPVGENQVVLRHGENGFTVDSREEWYDALNLLSENPGLCREMGENARRMAEAYSVRRYSPVIAGFLKTSFGGA